MELCVCPILARDSQGTSFCPACGRGGEGVKPGQRAHGNSMTPPSACTTGLGQTSLLLETIGILPFILGGVPVQTARPTHIKGMPALRYVSMFMQWSHSHWPYVDSMYSRVCLIIRRLYINSSGKHISEQSVQRVCFSECAFLGLIYKKIFRHAFSTWS